MNNTVRLKIEALTETLKKSTISTLIDFEKETGREVSRFHIKSITDTMRRYLEYLEEVLIENLKKEYLDDTDRLLTEDEFKVIVNSNGLSFKETIDKLAEITHNDNIKKIKILLDNEHTELDEATTTAIEDLLYEISTLITSFNRDKLAEIQEEVIYFSNILQESN